MAPERGKYLHDIIPRDSCTIADKNKGMAFWGIIKLCSSSLDNLIVIGDAITGDIDNKYFDNTKRGLWKFLIIKSIERRVIWWWRFSIWFVMNTEENFDRNSTLLYWLQVVISERQQTIIHFDQGYIYLEVIIHGGKWASTCRFIQDFVENGIPLPADTAKLKT